MHAKNNTIYHGYIWKYNSKQKTKLIFKWFRKENYVVAENLSALLQGIMLKSNGGYSLNYPHSLE